MSEKISLDSSVISHKFCFDYTGLSSYVVTLFFSNIV